LSTRPRAPAGVGTLRALVVAGSALAVLHSTSSAQTAPRPIPRELAGYRLGMPASDLPGWPQVCRHLEGATMVYCLVGFSGPELFVERDTVFSVGSGYVILEGAVGITSSEVWRTYAGPRAMEMFGPPDTVMSAGDTLTTAGWNPFGIRGVSVQVFRRNDRWAVAQMLSCRSASHRTSDIDFAACLRGDRP
jgi:hypothetical protein